MSQNPKDKIKFIVYLLENDRNMIESFALHIL